MRFYLIRRRWHQNEWKQQLTSNLFEELLSTIAIGIKGLDNYEENDDLIGKDFVSGAQGLYYGRNKQETD